MSRLSLFSIATAFLIGAASYAEACTGLKLTAKDGNSVHGRTLEFGIQIETSVVVIPRGQSFTGTTPIGKGITYQAKYGFLGAIAFDHLVVLDGMNEKGLSVGTFYFPGFAGYTPTTTQNLSRSLSPADFPNWILAQCATLEEVKSNLNNIFIAPTVIAGWGSQTPPFHYIVYDKQGKSLVIEPVDGKLVVHDNPIGVFTNSPDFDWHMTNLRNFINMSPKNVPPLNIDGMEFASFGQGSGMVGLPGDFTPPSRFVRAAIYTATAIPSETSNEAVLQTFHLLNQFDIPVGVAREVADDVIYSDYTLVTVVHDPLSLKYYYKTYEDQTIKVVDLTAFNLDDKQVKTFKTASKQTYIDVSKDLQGI